MKILSIDIGIKNLAFCLFTKPDDSENFCISKWDVINISDDKSPSKCCQLEKNSLCNKPVKYCKNNDYYCLKHAKKTQYLIPGVEHTPTYINKQKIQDLHNIALQYNLDFNNKMKKPEMISLINEHIAKTYFTVVQNKNASSIDLFTIGINIKMHFDHIFENEGKIDHVIIENQISPIATRMKTIQGMIVQYFIMSKLDVKNVEFISASNKLKEHSKKEDKLSYSDRKKLGINVCLAYLTNDFRFKDKQDYFSQHKKQDDLSDSFLQGIWYIKNKLNTSK